MIIFEIVYDVVFEMLFIDFIFFSDWYSLDFLLCGVLFYVGCYEDLVIFMVIVDGLFFSYFSVFIVLR